MVRTGVISDGLWEILEPALPPERGHTGRPWNDHRLTLEGICWRYRTGAPWRGLPAEFGPFQSVWERHKRWSTDGTYAAMLEAVRDQSAEVDSELDAELADLLSVDSTSVRAHQHAAGARFHAQALDGEADERDTGGTIELQEFAR
jgi:transposase